MNLHRNKLVMGIIVLFMVAHTIFVSLPANATTAPATSNFTVTMTANGTSYTGSKMTSSPVTITVAGNAAIEYSTDYGVTWQAYSVPITVTNTGVHHYLFREVGTISIKTANVHIMPSLTQQVITTSADSIYYVNAALQTSGDGKSWGSAFNDLQEAMDEAAENRVSNGDSVHIYVAQGTYKPSVRAGETDSRNAYFQMQNNVAIYGGFDAASGKRDIETYKTILSGDIGTSDDITDNAYHVFYHPSGTNLDNTAVLDGVTIIRGHANGTGDHSSGGGMYNSESSPTLTNVTISGNIAATNDVAANGGGMYNSESSPILENVTISGNTAAADSAAASNGGGIYNSESSPTMENVTISGNNVTNITSGVYLNAHAHGGGMYNSESSPTMEDVTISGNRATTAYDISPDGGGMYNKGSSPTMENVKISGNIARYGGGMYNDNNSSPTMENVTIIGNTAVYTAGYTPVADGGGMYNKGSSPTMENVTISGNTARSGGGMYNTSSSPKLMNVTISGNTASSGGGMYNKGSSPTMENVTIIGNTATAIAPALYAYGGGMYNENNSSPTMENVTIIGNKSNSSTKGAIYGGGGSIRNSLIIGNNGDPAVFNYTGTITTSILDITPESTGAVEAKFYDKDGLILPETYQLENIFEDISQHNYRLKANSPAINEGDNQYNSTETDLDRKPRIQGRIIDLGAYEFSLYNVLYDKNGANGGQEPVDPSNYEANQIATIVGNVHNLVKTGYTFTGWNTEADGSGIAYQASATLTMDTADITLYAQWLANKHTITFDTQGGSAVPSQTIPYNEKIPVPVPPTKADHTLTGWYVNNVAWDFNTPITGDMTLIAKWQLNEYTVTFDVQGGSAVPSQTISHNDKAHEPAPPTKAGHTFKGWYVNNVAWDFDTPITEDVSLTAKWQVVSTGGGGNSTPAPQPTPTPILDQIGENGEIHYRATLTRGNIQSIISRIEGTPVARLQFPADHWEEASLTASAEVLQYLENEQTNVLVDSSLATILVPYPSFSGFNEELFFRLTPVPSNKQETIEDKAQQNEHVQTHVGQQMTVHLFGQPMTIETNLQNRPVTITLPIPADVTDEQLQTLFVYIEHSDGTTEVKQGTIVDLPSGGKGISFEVTHFSTFALLYGTEKVIEEPQPEPTPTPTPTPEPEPITLAPYIQGYPDGTFKPSAAVTRAQMASMLARFLTNGDIPQATSTFTDTRNSGTKDAIEFVKQSGLFNGKTATTFGPNDTITRAQMASVVARWIETVCVQEDSKAYCTLEGEGKIFTDVKPTHWAAQAIEKVSALGIMTGNSATTFNPQGSLTRAQAVKVLNQLFERPALEKITVSTFRDVPATHWAIEEIEAAATEMIIKR